VVQKWVCPIKNGVYGNKQFASHDNTTPEETLPGEAGELVYAELELRLMADFGLVGLPNAGKSSMIRYLTNATPDVSDIPGTTLVPNLGQIAYRLGLSYHYFYRIIECVGGPLFFQIVNFGQKTKS